MMRVLCFSAFMAAMMVLASSLVLPEAKSDDDKTVMSHLVKRSTRCSSGWTGFNGRCYRYIPRVMSWAKAERNCQSMGANLASVHDIDEYHHIQSVIMKASHGYGLTWIGGTDAQQENLWFWSDGSPFRFTNWCPGEPNNHRGMQHCIQMNFGAQKCWDDQVCHDLKPSVCVKKTG